MKKSEFFFMGLLCATGLGIVGCEDDNSTTTDTETGNVEVLTAAQYLETQAATEAITGVSGEAFLTNTNSNKQASTQKTEDCAQRSSENLEGQVTVTLDYGEGCELGNGDTISGIVRITYDQNNVDDGATIRTELENYSYNDIAVFGSAVSVYNLEDGSGNFKFSSETDLRFDWPDGLTAISNSVSETETVFELTEESFSFYTLITGNGATEFSNGDSYSHDITTPLRTEISCAYIVSGVIVRTENESSVTRDYGDGTCDSIATETDEEGNLTTIDLDDIKTDEADS